MVKEIVLNEEDAALELESICEELGIEPKGKNYQSFLELVQQGRLMLDKKGLVVFTLEKPVESESGSIVLSELKFKEPNASELQRAMKGIKMTAQGDVITMDASDSTQKTINLTSALTGEGIGIIGKIKARDFEVLSAITSFFG